MEYMFVVYYCHSLICFWNLWKYFEHIIFYWYEYALFYFYCVFWRCNKIIFYLYLFSVQASIYKQKEIMMLRQKYITWYVILGWFGTVKEILHLTKTTRWILDSCFKKGSLTYTNFHVVVQSYLRHDLFRPFNFF